MQINKYKRGSFFCCIVFLLREAHAQSIARRHTTYVIMQKNLHFQNFFGKIKKEEFARRILKKKCIFAFKIVK
jgi:hypothetical protein